uniref:Uncharacterized protein n=1 Tax=Cyanothece sp. (strain PCC 7425 / ATCC 29141) TaxID=395961 RepID=B8HS52_CYAP4
MGQNAGNHLAQKWEMNWERPLTAGRQGLDIIPISEG